MNNLLGASIVKLFVTALSLAFNVTVPNVLCENAQ